MGKRIIQRARGKGGPTYRAPGHRYAGKAKYPRSEEVTVSDLVHDSGRYAPLARVRDNDGKEILMIVAEGVKVGDKISVGKNPKIGNILPLSGIPKGSYIFGIERVPQGGPKLCCTAGTHALVVSHEKKRVIIQMPSKSFKFLNPNCMATMGVPAGGGRKDKPFVKAGQKFFKKKARNKLWPRTSAVAMNAVDHPFGGSTKPGIPKSTSRWAPPGAKVGNVASRRTGPRKGKRKK